MAKIEHVEIFMADLLPKVKRTDAIQSFDSQETPFVRITDSDGATGLGYSYTIGQGGPAIMSLLKETMIPQLIGREAEEIERLWRDLLFSTHATSVGAITSLALAAIDTALWDLRCKRASLPLWRMLGGAKPSVPMYTTEGGWLHIETKALVDDALEAQALGFSGSKVKIGRPHLSEDRTAKAVRDAVGPTYEIMVDANQGFTLPEATRRAQVLEPLDIAWFEEPLPADDVLSHSNSRRHCPDCGGRKHVFRQSVQGLPDGTRGQHRAGRRGAHWGDHALDESAHMAEAHNIPVCPHFLMELHVSLVCAIPNAPWLEYIPQLDSLTATPMRMEAGRAFPSMRPDLGIDWDPDKLNAAKIEGLSATAS